MWHLANYAFFEPASTFSTADVAPSGCGPLIVSSALDVATRFPGARPVSYENDISLALWVVPSRVPAPVRATLVAGGFVGPASVSAPLADAAYRSSIRLTLHAASTQHVHFAVQLTHAGKGSAWPG